MTALLFAVLVCMAPGSAFGSSVDEVVGLISKNVLRYLEDQGKKELFVDQFKGPKTSGGRLLETRIREKLKADGVVILSDDLEASWTLRGTLSVDTSGKSAIVAVKVELLDGGGNSKAEFKKRFKDDPAVQEAIAESLPPGTATADADALIDVPDDVNKVVPQTVDTQSKVEEKTGVPVETAKTAPKAASTSGTPIASVVEEAKKILEMRAIPKTVQLDAIESPSFFADGQTLVRPSSKSGFGLEIRVSTSELGPFVPIVVENRGGQAFVNLQQGQFFQIHVFNNETFDVGMELRMDGINTMHFSENMTPTDRETGKWLILAGTKGAAIKGWFIHPQRVDRFVIKPEPEGVAAELGRPHQIGTIQASFFQARTRSQGPSAFAAIFDETRNAVGRGAPVEFGGQMLERVFESGQSLASIAIKYKNPSPPDLPPAALGN